MVAYNKLCLPVEFWKSYVVFGQLELVQVLAVQFIAPKMCPLLAGLGVLGMELTVGSCPMTEELDLVR